MARLKAAPHTGKAKYSAGGQNPKGIKSQIDLFRGKVRGKGADAKNGPVTLNVRTFADMNLKVGYPQNGPRP